MKTRPLLQWLALLVAISAHSALAASFVTIKEREEGRYDVRFGDKLFTTLHTREFAKPILYPIIGPHDIRMTRDYPMKTDTPNEKHDHPHHQSLWFTHDKVNGVGFWNTSKTAGKIVTTGVNAIANNGDHSTISFQNKWNDVSGKTICTDHQKITFHKYRSQDSSEFAAIDYEVTLHASEGDLVMGDTKEGTMAIRTHPDLRIDRGAAAVNSEGVTGKALWGKRADWVDYSAKIEGHTVGIAIFDHPSNPRHPTWWHARDYGLIGANPFGIHDFEKKPAGSGDMTIPKGQSVTFRYRFVFHSGDTDSANIKELYQDYK